VAARRPRGRVSTSARRLGLGLTGAILVLSACSSGSSSTGQASLSVGSSRLGSILVNRDGHSLYLFGSDRPGRSACVGPCTRVWPPATVSSRPTAGAAVSAAMVGTITRPDHSLQMTYDGHPLYTFSGDTARGQMNGEGFLGSWFVVSPRGAKVVAPGAPSTPVGY
jgi:predicted lipoprotein with Yx(FWY)xxD motif